MRSNQNLITSNRKRSNRKRTNRRRMKGGKVKKLGKDQDYKVFKL